MVLRRRPLPQSKQCRVAAAGGARASRNPHGRAVHGRTAAGGLKPWARACGLSCAGGCAPPARLALVSRSGPGGRVACRAPRVGDSGRGGAYGAGGIRPAWEWCTVDDHAGGGLIGSLPSSWGRREERTSRRSLKQQKEARRKSKLYARTPPSPHCSLTLGARFVCFGGGPSLCRLGERMAACAWPRPPRCLAPSSLTLPSRLSRALSSPSRPPCLVWCAPPSSSLPFPAPVSGEPRPSPLCVNLPRGRAEQGRTLSLSQARGRGQSTRGTCAREGWARAPFAPRPSPPRGLLRPTQRTLSLRPLSSAAACLISRIGLAGLAWPCVARQRWRPTPRPHAQSPEARTQQHHGGGVPATGGRVSLAPQHLRVRYIDLTPPLTPLHRGKGFCGGGGVRWWWDMGGGGGGASGLSASVRASGLDAPRARARRAAPRRLLRTASASHHRQRLTP